MEYRDSQTRHYDEGRIYFVTCNVKDWASFFKEKIFCELFVAELKLAQELKEFELYGFCLNYSHFHLLIKPGEKWDLSKIMFSIKKQFSHNVNRILGYNDFESLDTDSLKAPKRLGAFRREVGLEKYATDNIQRDELAFKCNTKPELSDNLQGDMLGQTCFQKEVLSVETSETCHLCAQKEVLFSEAPYVDRLKAPKRLGAFNLRTDFVQSRFQDAWLVEIPGDANEKPKYDQTNRIKILMAEKDKYVADLHHQFLQKHRLNHNIPKFHWQKSFRDHVIRDRQDFENHRQYTMYNFLKHNLPQDWPYTSLNYPAMITLEIMC